MALLACAALVALAACNRPQMIDDQMVVKDVEQTARDVRRSALSQPDKDAFAAAVALRPATVAGKTVRRVINEQKTYELGLRLAAQARAADARHRLQMARSIDIGVTSYRDYERTLELTLRVRNKTPKTIRRFDVAIDVDDAAHVRIGIAELVVSPLIPPRATVELSVAVPYVRFGEAAGSLVLAAGKPKTIAIDPKEIKFTDGTDVGYDD